jgi:hypothetical protein
MRPPRDSGGGGGRKRTTQLLPADARQALRDLSAAEGVTEALGLVLLVRRSAAKHWRLKPEAPGPDEEIERLDHGLPEADYQLIKGEADRVGAKAVSHYLTALLREAKRRGMPGSS